MQSREEVVTLAFSLSTRHYTVHQDFRAFVKEDEKGAAIVLFHSQTRT